jgi:uncharacterized protein (DUF952 family)
MQPVQLIYHIISPAEWERVGGVYSPASLMTEGFVHCSSKGQVERIANLFFADADALLVLCLDVAKLPEVRDESPEGNPFCGETFPHVYGPIQRTAVVEVTSLRRDASGKWRSGSLP